MGADRKGPLAAFVIIAIVAAVLLVTTVRSQAAPGWLDPDGVPASVVAAPPATDPHLWAAVTSSVHQVVQHGAVLVRDAAADESVTDGPDAALVAATTPGAPTGDDGRSTDAGSPQDGQQTADHAQGPPRSGHPGRHHVGDHVGDVPSEPPGLAPGGHGQGHGNGHHAAGAQGHVHANGHAHGHADGHGHGHGRPHREGLAG